MKKKLTKFQYLRLIIINSDFNFFKKYNILNICNNLTLSEHILYTEFSII